MDPRIEPAHRRRRWRRAGIVCALFALFAPVAAIAPAGAVDAPITVDVTVVDGHGHPFKPNVAGVLACPAIGWTVPCSALIAGSDDDGDGHVLLVVQPDVMYRANGFVRDVGWRDPGFVAPDGTEFHFSPLVDVTGRQLDGATFVVERPTGSTDKPVQGTTAVELRVVDGDGQPFPAGTAGVMACVSSPCDPMIFGGADADGVARLNLGSKVEYTVTALVHDTGWTCGAWVSPTGVSFWFSDAVIRSGTGFHRPTTLTIVQPVCV